MKTINRDYSGEENYVLFELYLSGGITIQEFLEFSDLSFAEELLNRVRKRTSSLPLQSSEQPQRPE
jgi:hypothetical protein